MADIVPAWMWRDPGQVIDRLLTRSSRDGGAAPMVQTRAPTRDRYYTQARRIEVQAAVRQVTSKGGGTYGE